MYRFSLTILILIFFSSTANAKYIYEYFDEIEPLLIEQKYDEADKKYEKLSKNLKIHVVDGSLVGVTYKKTVKWLKRKDELVLFLEKVNSQTSKYEPNLYNNGISAKKCSSSSCESYIFSFLNKGLPKTLPFSSEFVNYINNTRKETANLFAVTYKKVNEIAESEKKQKMAAIQVEKERKAKARKIERDRKTEEVRIHREKERLAREKKEKEKQEVINQEIAKVDALAKSVGYSGYENENIVSMIYKTQKEGGLEKYLNQVVGCHGLDKGPCEKWYPKLKAIQILDDGVLYSYSEYSRGEFVNFTVFAEKEPGKIYQEGQAFTNTFYVFKGMLSYTTVTGVKKTIPAFVKAKLNR